MRRAESIVAAVMALSLSGCMLGGKQPAKVATAPPAPVQRLMSAKKFEKRVRLVGRKGKSDAKFAKQQHAGSLPMDQVEAAAKEKTPPTQP